MWVNSGSWWWTGRPGVLRFMGLQRVGHDWATELKWIELNSTYGEGNGTPLQYFAWKIPWMEEPGSLQSMGSLRVGHDWTTSLSLFTFLHWRRKWQPTPVFLPGESQGRGSLVAAVCGITQSWTQLKWLSSSSRNLLIVIIKYWLYSQCHLIYSYSLFILYIVVCTS